MSDIITIGVEVYEVKIGINASDNLKDEILKILEETFPHGFSSIEFAECKHFLKIVENAADDFELYRDGSLCGRRESKFDLIALLRTEIRYLFSEFAVEKVIIHAGAVAINDYGIIFPGKSRSGKSNIVAGLIKNNGIYYSDDYAVLDGDALLHPYAKKISLRDSQEFPLRQTDYPVEHFRAVAGNEPIQVKIVILTEYQAGAIWNPKKLSNGEAMMEIIPHTAPIRRYPAFTLRTLDKLVRDADVYSGKRGDLAEFIPQIISLVENLR